jgi:hypothetical protein
MAMFARASCNAIRYSLLPTNKDEEVRHVLFLANLILQGIGAFTLSLTINHQRRYRSSAPVHPNPTPGGEKEPLVTGNNDTGWLKAISFVEVLFSIFFLVYLVFLYLALVKEEQIYQIVFLVAFIIQRLPIILIMIIIIVRHNTEGPTRKSKLVFLVAAILHLANDLPTFIWTQILPGGCPFGVASWLDALSLLNFISIILFFFFIRWEFLRNMEEVIWDKVNQIQTTFDFRRF